MNEAEATMKRKKVKKAKLSKFHQTSKLSDLFKYSAKNGTQGKNKLLEDIFFFCFDPFFWPLFYSTQKQHFCHYSTNESYIFVNIPLRMNLFLIAQMNRPVFYHQNAFKIAG